jgi:putative pyoverdin transport system ATP-binding/permease protein
MKIIVFLIRYSRLALVGAILTGLVSGALTTGLLALINRAITGKSNPSSGLVIVFIGMAITVPALRAASEALLIRVGQGALYSLRTELAGKILKVPFRRLEELGSHRILAVLTDDIPNITNFMTMIPILCISLAVVLSCLAYMLFLSSRLFAVVLGFMVVGIVGYLFPVTRAAKYFREARQEQDKMLKHFQALIFGIKELKLHRARRKAFLDSIVNETAYRLRSLNTSGLTIYSAASSLGQVLVFLVLGFLVFVAPSLVVVKQSLLVPFSLSVLYLTGHLEAIMNTTLQIGRARVASSSIDRFLVELATEPDEYISSEQLETRPAWSCLELKDLMYAYVAQNSGGTFVLGPINLVLIPGELLFVTGGNASGKTTLAKILTGLYSPVSGQIILDGEVVGDKSKDKYRQMFSAVFYDFHLFEGLLGIDGADLDERARGYLARMQLNRTIAITGGKFSTTDLSQGQRKRLALLTTFMEDRAIYLFDECAADQDTNFKQYFYDQILPELKARNKTVIVISHDERFFDRADRLIKLENGQIIVDKRSCNSFSHL